MFMVLCNLREADVNYRLAKSYVTMQNGWKSMCSIFFIYYLSHQSITTCVWAREHTHKINMKMLLSAWLKLLAPDKLL